MMRQHTIWCVYVHAHTPNVMLPHHYIDFLHFLQILKSMTLTRNKRAPWRWSEWWTKHVWAFLSVLIWTF